MPQTGSPVVQDSLGRTAQPFITHQHHQPTLSFCACVASQRHSLRLSVLVGSLGKVNVYLEHQQKIAVTKTSSQSEAAIHNLISVIAPSITFD